eukprot:2905340-Lingulodinium_polyedra.AAC.1
MGRCHWAAPPGGAAAPVYWRPGRCSRPRPEPPAWPRSPLRGLRRQRGGNARRRGSRALGPATSAVRGRLRGPSWMLRIGEASHPGPPRPTAFRLVSANITSWGSAAKCITRAGAD